MRRAPHVPQRGANSGRERAAAVTRYAERIELREAFGLVTGLHLAD